MIAFECKSCGGRCIIFTKDTDEFPAVMDDGVCPMTGDKVEWKRIGGNNE